MSSPRRDPADVSGICRAMSGLTLRPRLAATIARDLPREITVLGAGRAVRALMTVAALIGHRASFRIWCRHEARAELMRIHLADLPPLDVRIVVADQPDLSGAGPVVLALGRRTSRRSRQRSKDALFGENLALIEGLVPQLTGRTVLVVTNPCTQLTANLRARGVAALGVGVMNDQLRFARDAGDDLRLVGAHNPFELAFGRVGAAPPTQASAEPLAFARADYRALTNRQDRQRPLLEPDGLMARALPRLHEAAWRDLGAVHDGLDVAKRWYARQRLASRYLENGVACGRAILAGVDFVTGAVLASPDVTFETPLRLQPGGPALVAGWPLDAVSGEPRGLAFGPEAAAVWADLAKRYGLPDADKGEPALTLAGPLQPTVTVSGSAPGMLAGTVQGDGVAPLLADLAPLHRPAAGEPAIAVHVRRDPAALTALAPAALALESVAQHRGKNAFEHRDLTIQLLPGARRLVRFAVSGAAALIDDAARQITLACADPAGLRDEFRKLLRDQIAVPAATAQGAMALHAGFVSLDGEGLLLLGGSGAGKTTGALHLLARRAGGYGASERVLVWRDGARVMALGVPESLTVFPGSLRGLPAFADLIAGRDPARDWERASKLRLSRDAVVERTPAPQVMEPVAITRVILLAYDGELAREADVSALGDMHVRRAAVRDNDLTFADDVRAAWLLWDQPKPDVALVDALADTAMPTHRIAWRRAEALGEALAGLSLGGAA
jgi:hypothetical protein